MYRSVGIAALGGWLLAASAPLAYQPQLVAPLPEPIPIEDPLHDSDSAMSPEIPYEATPDEVGGSQLDACDCPRNGDLGKL